MLARDGSRALISGHTREWKLNLPALPPRRFTPFLFSFLALEPVRRK